MAHYVIGDIQGCHAEFCDLLSLIGFSPREDRLWFVGDLVNRGPDSLAVLRDVKALGDAAVTVLGNHDFHLLMLAGGHRKPHRGDTLDAVLEAPDRDELVDWLKRRPLVASENGWLLVHAGVIPQWTSEVAIALSREVEEVLASERSDAFLRELYGDQPDTWRNDLGGFDRLRFIVNVCTRLRFCTTEGKLELREKRGIASTPKGTRAWFAHESRRTANVTVICGHWSTLDLMLAPNVMMLDSGCVWGGALTAIRLPDRRVYQVPSRQPIDPMPSE